MANKKQLSLKEQPEYHNTYTNYSDIFIASR